MTTALLRKIAEQDQAELAARHNGTAKPKREHETRWVVETMARYLPPEHVALARTIRDLAARAAGLKLSPRERVDAGNAAEVALLSRLDAAQQLEGYRAAVRARLNEAGERCLYAIEQEHTMAQTLRACGLAARSDVSVRRRVQLTMLAAQDYADICADERARWRAL